MTTDTPAMLEPPEILVRAFRVEFRNAWQTQAYVILAHDAWQAINAAEQDLRTIEPSTEYPYRLTRADECAGRVVRAYAVAVPPPGGSA